MPSLLSSSLFSPGCLCVCDVRMSCSILHLTLEFSQSKPSMPSMVLCVYGCFLLVILGRIPRFVYYCDEYAMFKLYIFFPLVRVILFNSRTSCALCLYGSLDFGCTHSWSSGWLLQYFSPEHLQPFVQLTTSNQQQQQQREHPQWRKRTNHS